MSAVTWPTDAPQALPPLVLKNGCISSGYSRLLEILAAVILRSSFVVLSVWLYLGAGLSLRRAPGDTVSADARPSSSTQGFTQLLVPPPALSLSCLGELQGALNAVVVTARINVQAEAAAAQLQTLSGESALLRCSPAALHEDAVKALREGLASSTRRACPSPLLVLRGACENPRIFT